MVWRVIEDGLCDGNVNMATDHAILQACSEGKAPPTIRLYGWKCPTLSVGYSQDVDKDLNRSRCHELGVLLVRRPTGGRAILHLHELTYCVVAPIPHPQFPSNLRGAFQVIADALLIGMRNLGIRDAAMAVSRKGDARQGNRSPSCFSSLNHCEISVHGKKLIGSAQRRTHHAFLQHGSVIIKSDHALLNSLFKFNSREKRQQSLEKLMESTIALNEINASIGYMEVCRAVREGFRQSFAHEMVDGELTPLELKSRDNFLDVGTL